ncbi:MAG: tRNA pseudouridine(55) synthase TruB [Deltaproteobacteria bacterium]|nr:tRNA pseudouridine(55) synthase TruB [Deltaproteobacteria bacterium]
MTDGILLVDKPAGRTSADVVRVVKRRHRLQSIGHLGTLDPFATGVLPLCIDGGTRIAQFLAADRKAYEGRIRLGVATDTLDTTGRCVAEAPIPPLDPAQLDGVARRFVGCRDQVPPMYSAVRQGGKRLYELARGGVVVERAPRRIEIERLVLRPSTESSGIEFEVRCSKGTYVRVLAAEIGEACGTVAALEELRRTEFGSFTIGECVALDDVLEAPAGELPVLPPRAALRDLREIDVDGRTAFRIAAGQKGALEELPPPGADEQLAAVIAPGDRLLAVLGAEDGAWRLRRVVLPEASELYRG